MANLWMYLGIPINHKKVTKQTFNHLIKKVKDKLIRWQMKCLSMARRSILGKLVLEALPTYSMQVIAILVPTFKAIENHQRSFIQGHEANKRKIHTIDQSIICNIKECGGLGFRDLKDMNQAYLLKLVWKLVNNNNKLWVDVLKSKYGRNYDWLEEMQIKNSNLNL